jgi:hypothetical protein
MKLILSVTRKPMVLCYEHGKLVAIEKATDDAVAYTPINAKRAEGILRRHDTRLERKRYKAEKDVQDIKRILDRLG